MRPNVIFLRLFGFLPPIRTWHYLCFLVLLFLFFKFSLSLPSSLCSVAVSISCFMQTKKNKKYKYHATLCFTTCHIDMYVGACIHIYFLSPQCINIFVYICIFWILLLCCFLAIWRLLLASFIPVVVVLEFYSGSIVGFCFLPFASIGHSQGMQFHVQLKYLRLT